jgi:hypothetical protein
MEFRKKVQIGNFLLQKERTGETSYIKIWTATNSWSMNYWEGNRIFHLIDREIDTDEGKRGLHVFISNIYIFASVVDSDFIKSQLEIISAHISRAQEKALPDEEDAQILQSRKTLHKIEETLKASNP